MTSRLFLRGAVALTLAGALATLAACGPADQPKEGAFTCMGSAMHAVCKPQSERFAGFSLGMSKADALANVCAGPAKGYFAAAASDASRFETPLGAPTVAPLRGKPPCAAPGKVEPYDQWVLASDSLCRKSGETTLTMVFKDGRLDEFFVDCDGGLG
jgi:hypothetical protein